MKLSLVYECLIHFSFRFVFFFYKSRKNVSPKQVPSKRVNIFCSYTFISSPRLSLLQGKGSHYTSLAHSPIANLSQWDAPNPSNSWPQLAVQWDLQSLFPLLPASVGSLTPIFTFYCHTHLGPRTIIYLLYDALAMTGILWTATISSS